MTQPLVTVIGAGFSGTFLALGLRESCPAGTHIKLIECNDRFGRGLAYGTTCSNHLLNVPAGRMSAFPDRPLDFLDWLQARSGKYPAMAAPSEASFAPRRVYGDYISHHLQQALDHQPDNGTVLELVHDKVVGAATSPAGIRLHLASGGTIDSDLAVLASGNGAPLPPLDISAIEPAGLWRGEAWSAGAFQGLDPDAPVLLIGTGLTAIDAVILLLDAGHRGPIHALSRRGLLPQRHMEVSASPVTLDGPPPNDLASMTRFVRGAVRRATAEGKSWHQVIDALRPYTHAMWRNMSAGEQRRFLRHMRAWWDVHRHRMAPEIANRLAGAMRSGQLHIHAGRILGATVEDGLAHVAMRPRGRHEIATLQAARVINCTGPAPDVSRSDDPLLRSLLNAGSARPDAHRLGLDVTVDGAVLNRRGAPSSHLFAIGPLTKGAWWEMTAVPDIRNQCQSMARTLGETLTQRDVAMQRVHVSAARRMAEFRGSAEAD
jgi:uncharacterized NAD(P)/FAD-binding protein YdhS